MTALESIESLREAITDLPCEATHYLPGFREGYQAGHRDARMAAAELVRRHPAPPGDVIAAARKLCDALGCCTLLKGESQTMDVERELFHLREALAAAPPGDGGGEPITEELLVSVGFERQKMPARFPPSFRISTKERDWFWARVTKLNSQWKLEGFGQMESNITAWPKTRDDLLLLLSALGIKPSAPRPAGEQP